MSAWAFRTGKVAIFRSILVFLIALNFAEDGWKKEVIQCGNVVTEYLFEAYKSSQRIQHQLNRIYKKSLAQKLCKKRFRKVEVRAHPLQHLLYLCHSRVAASLCNQEVILLSEYNLFYYHKLDAEYFFIRQFFRKSSIFRENCEKLFWGHIWVFFRGKRHFAPQIDITFFITN